MKSPPETLAIRAVNQYRRRDAVGYLGLRLYLDNVCAARDSWAEIVASRLTLHDSSPRYHSSLHFKKRDSKTDKIEYRRLCLPTPNEILAETALLAECANAGDAFSTSESVYSYQLSRGGEHKGVFRPYFIGYRKRHEGIAEAARRHKDGVVAYTDIRRFYPSITSHVAAEAWESAAKKGELPTWARALGSRLLENYKFSCGPEENAILTGPMFAHLIANLVLQNIDEKMSQVLPDGYFRYVDDFALVGVTEDVRAAERKLVELLKGLGLSLNDSKRYETPASHWLVGASDFADEPHRVSWKTFVGKMKQLLIARPELTKDITDRLASEGFRIAPLDYSETTRERSYRDRIRSLVWRPWFRGKMHQATPDELLKDAEILRVRYQSDFWLSIEGASALRKYERKRRIHQLRRLASRLFYLAHPDELQKISEALTEVQEMELHAVIFNALAKRDVSNLVLYGANAAHSVVQGFLSSKTNVACSPDKWSCNASDGTGHFLV